MSLDDLGIEGDPVEDGETFETNAAIKARFGVRLSGLPTLADDSGLEVDALGGGPGVRTRRFAGENATDADNNSKLLGLLRGLAPGQRGARYVCVLAFARPAAVGPRGGLDLITTRGTCRGRIALESAGNGRVWVRPDLRARVGATGRPHPGAVERRRKARDFAPGAGRSPDGRAPRLPGLLERHGLGPNLTRRISPRRLPSRPQPMRRPAPYRGAR